MKTLFALVILSSSPLAPAVVIGIEDFRQHSARPIHGRIASGFGYDNFDGERTFSYPSWNAIGGSPTTGPLLFTDDSSALLEYNGPIEGVGSAANDGDDDHERSGAVRGVGQLFYRVEMTRLSNSPWSGVSSYDFGTERVFFGVPAAGFIDNISANVGIEVHNTGSGDLPDGNLALGNRVVTIGTTYSYVAVIDFDNDLLGLFVDPSATDDFWNPADGSNSAIVTLPYRANNWSTAVRLGSAGEGAFHYLAVATTPEEIGLAVPEPGTSVLGLLGSLLVFRRRR